MTRVAVVEPFFRTSGVTTYAAHLLEGFRRVPGVQADFLTFTLSGKPRSGDTTPLRSNGNVKSGWQWSSFAPDKVISWKGAAAAMSEYDLVVLNEPRCAPLDKRAMRKIGKGDIKEGRQRVAQHDIEYADVPEYIRALSESGTPWASCMHDPGYGQKLAPFLPQLLELAPPALIVTHRSGALESALWAYEEAGAGSSQRAWETPHLPFAFTPSERASWPKRVGMLGRYINNKGQPTLMSLAMRGMLPEGWSACVDGASPLGAGPNHTFLTYEAFLREGFEGSREGNGGVKTGDPWEARDPRSGQLAAAYKGPYQSGQEASLEHGVHVSATEASFSGVGSLEYADLEALASGAALCLPFHRDALQEYDASRYELLKCANAEMSAWDAPREATLEALSEGVASAAALSQDPALARASAERNFEQALLLNDPRAYAEGVLREALP